MSPRVIPGDDIPDDIPDDFKAEVQIVRARVVLEVENDQGETMTYQWHNIEFDQARVENKTHGVDLSLSQALKVDRGGDSLRAMERKIPDGPPQLDLRVRGFLVPREDGANPGETHRVSGPSPAAIQAASQVISPPPEDLRG